MAQDSASQKIDISGTVIDSSRIPISGATVKLATAGLTATTDGDGKFTLSGGTAPLCRPLGDQPAPTLLADTVTVSKTGYLDYVWGMTNTEIDGLVIRPARSDHPKLTQQHLYEIGSADFPSCHSASIVELQDGTLLSVYLGGSGESKPDLEVRLSRKGPSKDWETPISITDSPGSIENPVIFQERGGTLFVFYKITHAKNYRMGRMKISTDGGKTWGPERKLGEKAMGPEKNKPVQLDDGTILTPNADRNGWVDGGNLFVERSTDGGETWENTRGADNGGISRAIQPTMFVHTDGRLQIMARGMGKIPMTFSDDNGKTWSPLENSVLPGNWSGIDGVTLRDGRHFLVYNHVPTKGRKGHRRVLNAAVSKDGKVWQAAVVLGVCRGGQFSYPAVIQSRDGLIHIVHTWHRETINHIVVNPTLLETVPMPDGKWPTEGPLVVQALNQADTREEADKPRQRKNDGAPVPEGGYTWRADEGDTKTFDSPVDVAYGAQGKYNFKYGVTGPVTFDNNTFGDPIYGLPKEGFWIPSESKPAPPSNA
jgi:predicted neuraminidase